MNEIVERFFGMWFGMTTFPIVFLLFWGTAIGMFAGPALLLTKLTNAHYRHTKSGNEIYWGRLFTFLSIPWVLFISPIAWKVFTIGVDWYGLLIRAGTQIAIPMVIIGAALHYLDKHTEYIPPTASFWIRCFKILLVLGFMGACFSLLPDDGCYYEVGANGAVANIC
jgi:hypothetical protein